MDALVTLTAAALTPLSLARDAAAAGMRQGGQVVGATVGATVEVLEEAAVTLRAARTVLLHVADALEAGLVDDLLAGMEDVSRAVALVERVSAQVDQALPVLESATPTLGLMNSTLAQLEVTLAQLQAMPGVRMAKRLVGRPTQREATLELEPVAAERLF